MSVEAGATKRSALSFLAELRRHVLLDPRRRAVHHARMWRNS